MAVEGDAGRCPHLLWRNVLGAGIAAELLDYVVAREREFKPGVLRNRVSGKHRIDYSLRDAVYLLDLSPFETRLEQLVRSLAPRALDALRLAEAAVAPREFELSAYRDGGHFGAHIDTDERSSRVRVVSCVYYFAANPSRFTGGELRLHALPTLSVGKSSAAPPFIDIVPETDSLVVFPSWLRHEVLPVRVPSGAWADSRFTVNCWLHRLPPSDHATEGG